MKKSIKIILVIVVISITSAGLFFTENQFHFSDLLLRRNPVVEDEESANVIIYLLNNNYLEKSDEIPLNIKIDYWYNLSGSIPSRDCTGGCITIPAINFLFLNLRKGEHKLVVSSSDIESTASVDFTMEDKTWILVGFEDLEGKRELSISTSQEKILFD